MDVEKTIEFLLENQARFDGRMEANFVRSEERFAKAEARMDRVERVVARLATAGLKFRNEIRRAQLGTERQIKALVERQAETEDKLDSLIALVDRTIRRKNGRQR